MIRAVVDSNVYVSALVFGGIPRRVLELAEQGQLAVFVSDPIRAEVQQVLIRKFQWPPREALAACRRVWKFARRVTPQQTATACVDEDDTRVLECAMEARAHVVITGDSHLLRLRRFGEIEIVAPRAFLDFYVRTLRLSVEEPQQPAPD